MEYAVFPGLIRYYDDLIKKNENVCPIAHTYISVHIGILIDKNGNFLCAMRPEIRELVPVPCTIESETRTSNIAPHLLHDNLCYVANYSEKFKERHKAYVKQLENYVNNCPYDLYASAILKYVLKDQLIDDIKEIIPEKLKIPEEKLNVVFAVYGMKNEGIDLKWTDYYTSTLKVNGLCYITGNMDHIPKTYPKNILSTSGREALLFKGSHVGYIASQKIIHTLQYLIYAKESQEKTVAEYQLQRFFDGYISEDELRDWIEKNYPGKWKGLEKIIFD